MGERLAGKAVLVTGGTSGIGEATVELFVREGARVAFTGRNATKGAAMMSALGDAVFYMTSDVSDEQQIRAAIETVAARFGRLDVLFNNAGGANPGRRRHACTRRLRTCD